MPNSRNSNLFDKSGSKIKIINRNADLKTRNLEKNLRNSKAASPSRKVLNSQEPLNSLSRNHDTKINKTSLVNSNRSKIIRFTKRRNNAMSSIESSANMIGAPACKFYLFYQVQLQQLSTDSAPKLRVNKRAIVLKKEKAMLSYITFLRSRINL